MLTHCRLIERKSQSSLSTVQAHQNPANFKVVNYSTLQLNYHIWVLNIGKCFSNITLCKNLFSHKKRADLVWLWKALDTSMVNTWQGMSKNHEHIDNSHGKARTQHWTFHSHTKSVHYHELFSMFGLSSSGF